jgi:hypothetical protein
MVTNLYCHRGERVSEKGCYVESRNGTPLMLAIVTATVKGNCTRELVHDFARPIGTPRAHVVFR